MVRSILFPKPVNLKFYSDSIKFIIAMAVLGEVPPSLSSSSVLVGMVFLVLT